GPVGHRRVPPGRRVVLVQRPVLLEQLRRGVHRRRVSPGLRPARRSWPGRTARLRAPGPPPARGAPSPEALRAPFVRAPGPPGPRSAGDALDGAPCPTHAPAPPGSID